MQDKTVSTDEMRALDREAIDRYGIPGMILMENAGRGAVEVITRTFEGRRVLVVCGKGNNGGDGFVIARHLWNRSYQVQLVLLAPPETLEGDARMNCAIVEKMRIPLRVYTDAVDSGELEGFLHDTDFVIDALLGIGVTSAPRGSFAEVIEAINASARPVCAVDIPSGLNSDSGEAPGKVIQAVCTVTMARVKKGLQRGRGPHCAGELHVIDISLPASRDSDSGDPA